MSVLVFTRMTATYKPASAFCITPRSVLARLSGNIKRSSRASVILAPTVKVRMKENDFIKRPLRHENVLRGFFVR